MKEVIAEFSRIRYFFTSRIIGLSKQEMIDIARKIIYVIWFLTGSIFILCHSDYKLFRFTQLL